MSVLALFARARRLRRTGITIATTAVAALGVSMMPTVATAASGSDVIASDKLQVRVATDFPRVLGYTDLASGATLGGQPDDLSTVVINGKPYQATDAVATVDGAKAAYTLTFGELPGVELDASLSVAASVLTFRIEAVRDTAGFRVGTIDIPNHDLVSVASDQAGAASAFAKVDPNSTTSGDTFAPVTAQTPADAAPVGSAYALVNTGQLAAAVETNSSYDKPSGAANRDNARLWHQARKAADGTVRVGVWSGQWTYRGDTAAFTEPLPKTQVVVTGDANADNAVNWQDGAVAFRDTIGVKPPGGEKTADRVTTRIPFNFASMATNPFLRTLDNVKRVSLATDGLGQLAILKGYGSEGHDSAHPDYGGNYNRRAGGLADLNKLLAAGEGYNADFGVHVNATESYPEAKAFSETLVDKNRRCWDWIDQSYCNNMRRDLASGAVVDRFAKLRAETHPNLEMLYIDVYYEFGWLPDALSRQLHDQGWQIGSEWSYSFERSTVWSHWANDRNYGGATNKGLNSQIIRFVHNHEKDLWNPHPIIGNAQSEEFEGWTGENDWNVFYRNIWENNLPAKFLQHYEIQRWAANEVRFSGGVRGTSGGGRKLYLGDAKVLDGGKYLLPWDGKKLYHYNPSGGTSTWTVPAPFTNAQKFEVYKLTDTGRVRVTTAQVRDGTVTLNAAAGQPYVLYPTAPPATPDVKWGEGTPVKDPGFNAGNLEAWTPSGSAGIARLDNGQHVAELGGGPAAGIEQRLTGLTAGRTYSASAWVEVEPGKTRRTTLTVDGAPGVNASSYVDRSTWKNTNSADDKRGTHFQRVRVLFDAPASGEVSLKLTAAEGAARVRIDDVRVVATKRATKAGTMVFEDFENTDQGWWPFAKGDAGGGDPRTHLSELHDPYTQKGWNGKLTDDVLAGEWSLKAHEERQGLLYRTVPQSVRFEAGHKYRVSFDYQSSHAGHYAFVAGYDTGGTSIEPVRQTFGEQRTTAKHTYEFTPGGCGDYYVGVRKLTSEGAQADADLVLDNVAVTDLGPASDQAACATLDLTAAPQKYVPGEPNALRATFVNRESAAAANVQLAPAVPDGWTATARGATSFDSVASGASVTATWLVTPPADAATGNHRLTVAGSYQLAGAARTLQAGTEVGTLPAGMIPQPVMRIRDVDSQELSGENGAASNMLDGDSGTFWHTEWSESEPAPPHHVTLDLGGTYDVKKLHYLPRQGQSNGRIAGYEVYVSTDGQSWGDPVAKGTWPGTTAEQVVELAVKRGRYLKLVALGEVSGRPWTTVAELNVSGDKVAGSGVVAPWLTTVHDVSSDEAPTGGAADKAIDGNPATGWHTAWTTVDPPAPYPHHLALDLGASYEVSAVNYLPRQFATNGLIKGYQVYVSTDGTSWSRVAEGEFTASRYEQRIGFVPTRARYVKLVATSPLAAGTPFGYVAELTVTGTPV
ncbi:MAG: endo-alpha-N-acetylgalactosaminidase family protein [Micromonosporaceae bacterium]